MNDNHRLVSTNYSHFKSLSVMRTTFPFFGHINLGPRSPQHPAIRLLSGIVLSSLRYYVAVQHMSIRGWDWIVSMFVSLCVYNWITTFAPVFRCHSHLNLSFHREHKPDYAGPVLRWKSGVTDLFFIYCWWLEEGSRLHSLRALYSKNSYTWHCLV